MICELCNKRKATGYIETKRVCAVCYEEAKANYIKKICYKCTTCGKDFMDKAKLSIPFCSKKCRVIHEKRLSRDDKVRGDEEMRELISSLYHSGELMEGII